MSKTSGEAQSGEPKFEIAPQMEGYEAVQEKAKEDRPDNENSSGKQKPQQGSAAVPPAVIPDASPVQIPVTDDTTSSSASTATSDLPAQDLDRIEKQWVEKAKKIVAQTQDDPYKQKKELSKAGADYMKKRFNKTIPTDDAVRA